MITYYNGLHQLSISKVGVRTNLDNDQKFKVVYYFTDGYRFVCQATAEPTMRDHRTGDWLSFITVAMGKDLKLSISFTQILKDHVNILTTELIYLLTGE